MESCTLCCLNIVLAIACLVIGVAILRKLALVVRMLEQPVSVRQTLHLINVQLAFVMTVFVDSPILFRVFCAEDRGLSYWSRSVRTSM